MKDKKVFRVEYHEYGVAIFGVIRSEQMIAILETWDCRELEMAPDMELANKIGAVIAVPWQREMARRWHDEIDTMQKENTGVLTLSP